MHRQQLVEFKSFHMNDKGCYWSGRNMVAMRPSPNIGFYQGELQIHPRKLCDILEGSTYALQLHLEFR